MYGLIVDRFERNTECAGFYIDTYNGYITSCLLLEPRQYGALALFQEDVFNIEERLSYQHLLHHVVRGICDISDKTENVAGRLTIVATKRHI